MSWRTPRPETGGARHDPFRSSPSQFPFRRWPKALRGRSGHLHPGGDFRDRHDHAGGLAGPRKPRSLVRPAMLTLAGGFVALLRVAFWRISLLALFGR